MTRLLFPICAALLSTLAGLHLSTHLRQEEQSCNVSMKRFLSSER